MNAPDLAVVVEFLNTLDERSFVRHGVPHTGGEALTSPEALATWLTDHELTTPHTHLTGDDLDAALELRTGVRAALAGTATTTDAPLARFPFRLAPAAAGTLTLVPADGPHPALGELAVTVARAVADGRWHRVRLCAAPDCGWAFQDTSRNGTSRWCSMSTCGNRHKTRNYRQRRGTTTT